MSEKQRFIHRSEREVMATRRWMPDAEGHVLFSPGRGDRSVATGGAARRHGRPTRNPWFRSQVMRIAPDGATEVRRDPHRQLLSPLTGLINRHEDASTGCAAPEADWLHPWLQPLAPAGAKSERVFVSNHFHA